MSIEDPKKGRLPAHVTMIMDGNGRWAQSIGKNRTFGHRTGASRFQQIAFHGARLGIRYLSFYAFSKENWKRPRVEVSVIMRLWRIQMFQQIEKWNERNIRVVMIGDRNDLPAIIRKQVETTERETAKNTGTTIVVFLSYGSRWEILEATRDLARRAKEGKISPEDITEEVFSSSLKTVGIPDPDLLIRTSGEERISNYLLWQLSYSELIFVPEAWPEFTPDVFDRCLGEFWNRERRYGKTSAQVHDTEPAAEDERGGELEV